MICLLVNSIGFSGSAVMEDENAQIIVNEDGAFIPRALFGREDIIINELREGGVLSPSNGEPSKKALLSVEMPDRTAEFRWIAEHRQEYAGQWVALHGDRLLSHSTDAREVFATARQSGIEAPFFAHIEPMDALPFGGW